MCFRCDRIDLDLVLWQNTIHHNLVQFIAYFDWFEIIITDYWMIGKSHKPRVNLKKRKSLKFWKKNIDNSVRFLKNYWVTSGDLDFFVMFPLFQLPLDHEVIFLRCFRGLCISLLGRGFRAASYNWSQITFLSPNNVLYYRFQISRYFMSRKAAWRPSNDGCHQHSVYTTQERVMSETLNQSIKTK